MKDYLVCSKLVEEEAKHVPREGALAGDNFLLEVGHLEGEGQ